MKKDDITEKMLSRRNFLKTAGGAAAVAGLATTGIPLMTSQAQAACDALPKKWDETYDVVVIGSGFAGLAAAIEAKNAGARRQFYYQWRRFLCCWDKDAEGKRC